MCKQRVTRGRRAVGPLCYAAQWLRFHLCVSLPTKPSPPSGEWGDICHSQEFPPVPLGSSFFLVPDLTAPRFPAPRRGGPQASRRRALLPGVLLSRTDGEIGAH